MIVPTGSCQHPDSPRVHFSSCPAVAEPQPLNPTQLAAESNRISHDILTRLDEHGNPLFPNLSRYTSP